MECYKNVSNNLCKKRNLKGIDGCDFTKLFNVLTKSFYIPISSNGDISLKEISKVLLFRKVCNISLVNHKLIDPQ